MLLNTCDGVAEIRDGEDQVRLEVDRADGRHHEVAHILAREARCGRHVAHRVPVAAIQREGDPHPLTVLIPTA